MVARGRCQRLLSVATHLSTKASGLLCDLFRGGEVRRKPSLGNHGVFSAAEYRQGTHPTLVFSSCFQLKSIHLWLRTFSDTFFYVTDSDSDT